MLTDTKTLDADVGLPLPPLCIAALRDRAAAADQEPNGGFVISTRSGGPVDPRNFYRAFQRRVAKATVPRIPVHGTRPTTASLLVELDVRPRAAMQILRHAKIATTMDAYTHAPTAATRTATDRISRALD